jgi:hypothetical protein
VCTVLLITPVVFGLFFNVFFIVAAAIWLFILPIALRDVWRAVRTSDDPPPVVIPPEPKPPGPGESILDRKPPRRW